MTEYRALELYPIDALREPLGREYGFTEMVYHDHAFLCGMLKQRRPKKVLEVGVAAGVTSALLLACAEELQLETTLYSLDVSQAWYRDHKRKTGFVAEHWKEQHPCHSRHVRLFGTVAEQIEAICADGEKIDFLILDTMHTLPGELLDYLICDPFLTEDAAVILHDLSLTHLFTMDSYSYATRLLFDLLRADKYYLPNRDNIEGLSNIGGLVRNAETASSLPTVFRGLYYPWLYLPTDSQLTAYQAMLAKLYGPECASEFDSIVRIQRHTLCTRTVTGHWNGDAEDLLQKWAAADSVYLYGCGDWGRAYYAFAREYGLPVSGMVHSDGRGVTEAQAKQFDGTPVLPLSAIVGGQDNLRILLAVGRENRAACLAELKKAGMEHHLLTPTE